MIRSYIKRSEQFRAQMEESISSLREDLSSLNDSVSNLSVCLQEHKQQTAADIQQLNSKLNTLTAIQQCDSQEDSPTQNTSDNSATMTTATTTTPPTTAPPELPTISTTATTPTPGTTATTEDALSVGVAGPPLLTATRETAGGGT